jgi:DNA-binding transcriptional regulator YiaG
MKGWQSKMKDNQPLYKRLPKNEPTIGGFIILHIKRHHGLRYCDFHHIGFGKNTVEQWVTGRTRPTFDDIRLICKHYNQDISAADEIAELLREQYRRERDAA